LHWFSKPGSHRDDAYRRKSARIRIGLFDKSSRILSVKLKLIE
jgi:hypothetical protein